MDFDQLEIFLEVARLSSFSRAAEKRFRTQPAISSQIRALEEEVGARLLDRSGGRVSLTASGKLFFKYAEETLERRKTILTEIAETERVPRGEIVVGANEGTCLHILPEVFAQFKRDYPNVAVSIKRSDYAKILESLDAKPNPTPAPTPTASRFALDFVMLPEPSRPVLASFASATAV